MKGYRRAFRRKEWWREREEQKVHVTILWHDDHLHHQMRQREESGHLFFFHGTALSFLNNSHFHETRMLQQRDTHSHAAQDVALGTASGIIIVCERMLHAGRRSLWPHRLFACLSNAIYSQGWTVSRRTG